MPHIPNPNPFLDFFDTVYKKNLKNNTTLLTNKKVFVYHAIMTMKKTFSVSIILSPVSGVALIVR
jgi:hypothetical protein